MEILTKLYENGILEITGVVNYFFRAVAWFIVVVCAKLVNGIESAVEKVYTLNNFFNSDEVISFINDYKPLVWSILGVSIAVLGYRIIFYKKKNRENLPANILFSILVLVLLPTFMIKLGDITSLGIEANKESSTSANKLIQENIYDMYYLDQHKFELTGTRNSIDEDNILSLPINEKVDDDEIKNKDVFKNKLVIDESGEYKKEELDRGWFTIDEDYYRYNTDFLVLIISLATTGITLICIGLKVARLIFELAFNKLFATLMAFADIEDGQRIRSIVNHIISIFIVIFTTSILIKLYIIFITWLNGSLGKVDVGLGFTADNLAKIIIQLGASIAVIDGPNIVERILGIDAGLKSGWGALATGYGLAKGSKGIFSNVGKNATKGGALLAGAGVGLGSNISSIFKNSQSASSTSSNANKHSTLQSEMKQRANALNGTSAKNNNSVADTIQELDKKDASNTTANNQPDLQAQMNNDKLSNSTDNQPDLQNQMSNDKLNNSAANQPDLQNQMSNDKLDNSAANQLDLQAQMNNDKLNNSAANQPDLQNQMSNDKLNNSAANQSDLQAQMNNDKLDNSAVNHPNLESQMSNDKLNNSAVNQPDLQNQMSNDKLNNSAANQSDLQAQMSNDKFNNAADIHPDLESQMSNDKFNKNGANNQSNLDSQISNDKFNKDGANNQSNLNSQMSNDKFNKDGVNNQSNLDSQMSNDKFNKNGDNNQSNLDSQLDNDTSNLTLGDYVKNKFNTNNSVKGIKRAYNLGKNTTSKWKINNKGDKNGDL